MTRPPSPEPRRIYLDYNATRPVRPEVRHAIEPILFASLEDGGFGNASSVHWAGQQARVHLEAARSRLAKQLLRRPSELVFTSGGTEADNLALDGVLGGSPGRKRLIVSAVEHPAVMAAAMRWRDRGAEVELVSVQPDGALDLDALARALDPGADLVSLMAVNNETGFCFDLEAAAPMVKAAGARLHVDAVQAAGRLPLEAIARLADLLVLSAHKLGGPPGVGLLAVRESIRFDPALVGGPQERGRRAGTESVAAAVGLATAVELAEAEHEAENARLAPLRSELENALDELPGARVLRGAPRVAPVCCAVFEGVDGEVMLQALDLEGIAVSSGSACSSGSLEPSPVLLALGLDPALAQSAVRFSLGSATTEAEIQRVVALLPALLERARV